MCGVWIEEPSYYGFLCKDHAPVKNNVGCDHCPNELTCMLRVRRGLWVVCENPSPEEIRRAVLLGIQIDNQRKPVVADIHI